MADPQLNDLPPEIWAQILRGKQQQQLASQLPDSSSGGIPMPLPSLTEPKSSQMNLAMMGGQNAPPANPNFDPATLAAAKTAPPPRRPVAAATSPLTMKPPAKAERALSAEQRVLDSLQGPEPEGMGIQRQGISDTQEQLKNLLAKSKEKQGFQSLDLSPLMALSDAWTGSKFAQSYKAPTSEEARTKMSLDLMDKINSQRSKLADNELDRRKQIENAYLGIERANAEKQYASNASIPLRMDEQAKRAGDIFDKDSSIKTLTTQAQQVHRGLQTLEAMPYNKVTHEIVQDFATAISGAKGSSDYRVKSIITPTLEGKLADLISFLSSNPNQPAPPEVVAYLKEQGHRLEEAYKQSITSQANTLRTGRSYKNNPAANDIMDAKHKYLTSGAYLAEGSSVPPPPPTGDSQPPHGQRVMQNGHAYDWNPKTGKYE